MAGEIVPRVTPEGRLSCSRCMIRIIAPLRVSISPSRLRTPAISNEIA
jgi:hypothetical protein